MGAGGSGILLHEAIGHAFEADFNRKNTSIFSDQLNKKFATSISTWWTTARFLSTGARSISMTRVWTDKNLYRTGGSLDQLSARSYQRKTLRHPLYGQWPPGVFPSDAYPPYACHLYGSGQRDGRGDHLYRKERYLCRPTSRTGRYRLAQAIYLLREGWLLDRERQAHPTYQGYQYHR